ncbi:hypothetical protein ES705_02313 [subsurface metagenome]|nr:LemA family protein [Clostridia bacterium]
MSLIRAVIRRAYLDKLYPIRALSKRQLNGIKKLTGSIKEYFAKHQILAWLLRTLLTVAIAAIVWALIHWYNDYARVGTRAEAYFAQVGVEMKRRTNLIPNLVVAARKYAFHEEEIFKHVSDAREMFVRAKNVKQRMEAAEKLDAALSKLLALVERYPDLKATESIQDLIKELSNTENRIAEQKAKYNEVARMYNQLLSTFPTNILGRIYGFGQRKPYIGAESDLLKAPEVDFEWKEDSTDE